MITRPLKYLNQNLRFRQQISLSVFIGITLLVIITSLSIQGTSEKILNQEYIAQGKQILGELSNKSKLALLYRSIDSAKDASTAILAFPGITSTRIYNADHSSLYSNDPILVSLDTWPHTGVVIKDKENSWQFTTAVYNSTSKSPFEDEQTAELVGYVSLVMSKNKMKELEETLLINNLTISLLIACILLLCLNTITKHAALPIEDLASSMSQADSGDLSIRSTEEGPIDIVNMEKAFNSMMNTLEAREKELERARDSALASANAKGEFAAAVSHELRTPMNGVMGMLQLLSQEISDNKRVEYLKIAMSSSQSLLALIDDILDFSKFESGHIQLTLQPFNAATTISEICALLKIQAQRKNISLTYDIDSNIPEWIYGDNTRIRQVLINLIGNAIKFTHTGGVNIHLSVDTTAKKILFSVKDTGIGIPDTHAQQIFEAFAQVDSSTTREFGGTGLGLAICRQLIQLMGGEIKVTSKVDLGSTFTISLPLQTESQEPSPQGIDQQLRHLLLGSRIMLFNDSDEAVFDAPLKQQLQEDCYYRELDTLEQVLPELQQAVIKSRPFDTIIIASNAANTKTLIDSIIQCTAFDELQCICSKELRDIVKHQRIMHYSALPITAADLIKRLDRQTVLKKITTKTVSATKEPKNTTANITNIINKPAKILIAEDNRANQFVALGMLEQLGYQADTVEDGSQVLSALEESQYQLILMDCQMPTMDGYSCTQLIRKKFNKIPVIAMTAKTGDCERQRCLDAGMNDYLAKPLQQEALKEILQRHLSRTQLNRSKCKR